MMTAADDFWRDVRYSARLFLSSPVFGATTCTRARLPWSFAVAAAWIVAVTLIASYLPSRRASRVDPAVALRAE
jgi:ABC-type lipoprotein release transport system permease subunit